MSLVFVRKIATRAGRLLPVAWHGPLKRRAVIWGSFRRSAPFSFDYGYDRGTPVDRYYIEKFLMRHESDIRGRVLEVKDGTYARRFGGERVEQLDILDVNPENPNATLIADLNNPSALGDRRYDCIIITQTLQYVYDLKAAVAALEGSLAPGGVILVTLPGITRIAYAEMGETWLWSFTEPVARKIFRERFEPGALTVEASGNLIAATAFLHGLAAEELRSRELEEADPDYQVIITVRALRSGS
jgi:hypothetical protein